MAYRTLELTMISAKDLKDVNLVSKMSVYAVATLAGDHRSLQRTPADHGGGRNPSWNAILRLTVPTDPAAAGNLTIHIVLRSERALGDRDVGEIRIPLKDLLHDAATADANFISYQVRKSSGRPKGTLNLSYVFLDLPARPPHVDKPDEPVLVYPPPGGSYPVYPPPGGSYSVYPPPGGSYPAYPPPGGYGYTGASQPLPQPSGYGYTAAPAGYGYTAAAPPQRNNMGYSAAAKPRRNNMGYSAAAKPRRNNLGMGLGAGMLGGMLLGDMMSDADHDSGFGDGMDNDSGFGDGMDGMDF